MVAVSLGRLLQAVADMDVVSVVGTAAAGHEAATRLRPDVVLLDYQLPDMDGITTAVGIKQAAPSVQVVILTGADPDEALALRAVEAGCLGFVTKSSPVDELVAAIRAAAAGEALISPSMLAVLLPRLERSYRGPASTLSFREIEVLSVMAEGASDKEISYRLSISLNTARKHVQNVIRKLGAHSKLEAVVMAAKQGVLRPF